MADRDADDRGVLAEGLRRIAERAEQGEGLEVDPDQLQPRLAAGGDVPLDELLVRDDEEHTADAVSVLPEAVIEDAVVEHRLVERDRKRLLRPEANRVGELLRVGDPGDLEGADADPIVGDPEAHAVSGQLVLAEEGLQGRGELLGLTQLSADDDAPLERHACHPDDLRAALVDHLGGGDLRGAQLEADELAVLLRRLVAASLRLAALAAGLLRRRPRRRARPERSWTGSGATASAPDSARLGRGHGCERLPPAARRPGPDRPPARPAGTGCAATRATGGTGSAVGDTGGGTGPASAPAGGSTGSLESDATGSDATGWNDGETGGSGATGTGGLRRRAHGRNGGLGGSTASTGADVDSTVGLDLRPKLISFFQTEVFASGSDPGVTGAGGASTGGSATGFGLPLRPKLISFFQTEVFGSGCRAPPARPPAARRARPSAPGSASGGSRSPSSRSRSCRAWPSQLPASRRPDAPDAGCEPFGEPAPERSSSPTSWSG